MNTFADQLTVSDARDDLMNNLEEGRTCPCCGQFAKEYRRRITGSMAAGLLTFYLNAGREWGYLPELVPVITQSTDFGKLRYWGLVEQQPGERDDGSNRTGWWRITEKGERFIHGGVNLPRYAFIYNGEVRSFDKTRWNDIYSALGNNFNYKELMGYV